MHVHVFRPVIFENIFATLPVFSYNVYMYFPIILLSEHTDITDKHLPISIIIALWYRLYRYDSPCIS